MNFKISLVKEVDSDLTILLKYLSEKVILRFISKFFVKSYLPFQRVNNDFFRTDCGI